MRGNNVMSGYFHDEAATAAAFAGGWFHSGDLAVWHRDGTIELRDRGKDIIISGGENISSIEVEQAISAHPAVLECAVVGIPDPHWGERPKAYVTLNPGAAATPGEIIAFCRDRLAHYKCPDTIQFGPLPKTSTGKIQKFVLRDPRTDQPGQPDQRSIIPGRPSALRASGTACEPVRRGPAAGAWLIKLADTGRLELVRLVGGEAVSSGDRVPEAGERLLAGGRLALWDVGGPQEGVGSTVAVAAVGDLALRPLGEIGVHLG